MKAIASVVYGGAYRRRVPVDLFASTSPAVCIG